MECAAQGILSGTLATTIALDFSGGAFGIQTDSDTYSQLEIDYTLSDWAFGSISTFSMSGLDTQEFFAAGSLGLIVFDSRLLFFPIAGSGSGLISDTKSANGVEHVYDFGALYFVNSVSVTSITVVPVGTQWRIKTSQDGIVWSDLPYVSPSGPVHVGELARYVGIYVATGGAYIDESGLTVSVSGESWTGTARYATSGMTLTAQWALASGGSDLTLGINSSVGSASVDGKLYFDVVRPDCSLCFDKVTVKVRSSLACVDSVTTTLEIDEEGFEELSFAATGLPLGVAGMSFGGKLAFSLTEKSLQLTPTLDMWDTACFTLYASLVPGSGGALDISGISLYGIRMVASLNGVKFESLTYLDDIHHTKANYWEMFRIEVDGDTCCGGGFDFEVTTHFGKTHATLFDWAETEFNGEFGFGENYVFSNYVSFTSAGIDELAFGVGVSW